MKTRRQQESDAQRIKRKLYAQGVTLKQWALDHNYPVTEVYKVVNGERKGLYGRAHQIAKDLGMWDGAK